MEINKKLLGICSYCKNIRIRGDSEDPDAIWISKSQDPRLYQRFIEIYPNRLTHGTCPSCVNKHYLEYDK